MTIKYNTWTGTYYIYQMNKNTQLRKTPTPKMKEIMENNKPKIVGHFKVWKS